ncbi:MAG TPA: hypothetical protein VK989_15450, partial [Polyangia bacterium]|nr:hypothetical protein [Polyangia bacterium]
MNPEAAFRAAFGDAGGDRAREDALAARLGAWIARGRAAHPTLLVDPAAFAGQLARAAARLSVDAPDPDSLVIEDLFLAGACAAGAPGA